MPYVIEKVNGKVSGLRNVVMTAEEIDRLRGDGNTYVVVNTTTRRRKTIGGKAKKATAAKPRKRS